jgi:hypothetical protein
MYNKICFTEIIIAITQITTTCLKMDHFHPDFAQIPLREDSLFICRGSLFTGGGQIFCTKSLASMGVKDFTADVVAAAAQENMGDIFHTKNSGVGYFGHCNKN